MSRTSLRGHAKNVSKTKSIFSSMRWKLRYLSVWRTTTQVVALVIGTLATSIALLTFLHMRTSALTAYEERISFAVRQGELVERAISAANGNLGSPQMVGRIQHLMEDVGSVGGMLSAFFVDRNGLVLAHSDSGAVGTSYRNPDIVAALDTGKVNTAKEQDNGRIRLDIAVPVRYHGAIVGAIETQFSLESMNAVTAAVQRDAIVSAVLVALILIPVAALIVGRLQHTLERMAITDGLTGLYDHRYFRQRLEQEIKRAQRYGGEVALILFDIDSFKTFNDNYGHMAGDEAIRRVAETLRISIREVDIPARYGGEEFAAILPQTSLDQAFLVAERVRKALQGCFDVPEHPDLLTASFGVASFPADATFADELIRCADMALYHAKLSGKNRSFAYVSVPRETPVVPG